MKVKKIIVFSSCTKKTYLLKKKELASLKVLEKRGYLERATRNSVNLLKRDGKIGRPITTRLPGTYKRVFLAGKSMNRDEIRKFSLPNATGYVFTTQFGRLNQTECIKKGTGGKLISYLVSLFNLLHCKKKLH